MRVFSPFALPTFKRENCRTVLYCVRLLPQNLILALQRAEAQVHSGISLACVSSLRGQTNSIMNRCMGLSISPCRQRMLQAHSVSQACHRHRAVRVVSLILYIARRRGVASKIERLCTVQRSFLDSQPAWTLDQLAGIAFGVISSLHRALTALYTQYLVHKRDSNPRDGGSYACRSIKHVAWHPAEKPTRISAAQHVRRASWWRACSLHQRWTTSWPGANGGSWDCARSAAVYTTQTCAPRGNAQAEERVLHSSLSEA